MTFNRWPWYLIALAVVVINVAGGIFAYLTSEPIHGFVHGAFALGFGLWARHLHGGSKQGAPRTEPRQQPDRVEMLEADLSEVERELRETRARLDFADQLLKNKPPPT
jgi:hypothetical protein